MRLLIKTLVWGVAVLALLCVAAPYGVGWLLAGRFDQTVAHLSVPGYLQIVRRNFDRGWFVSRAIVVLRPIGPLCHTKPCPVVTLDSRIDHGPLAWGAEPVSLVPVLAVVKTQADLTSLWPRYVFSPSPGPLTVTSRIRLDSRGQAQLSLKGITFDVARQNPVAHVETATVSGSLQSGLLARQIHGLTSGLAVVFAGASVGRSSRLAQVEFPARPAPTGRLPTGDSRLTRSRWTTASGHATRLTDLKIVTRQPAPDTTAVSIKIEQLVLPDNTQGTFILMRASRVCVRWPGPRCPVAGASSGVGRAGR